VLFRSLELWKAWEYVIAVDARTHLAMLVRNAAACAKRGLKGEPAGEASPPWSAAQAPRQDSPSLLRSRPSALPTRGPGSTPDRFRSGFGCKVVQTCACSRTPRQLRRLPRQSDAVSSSRGRILSSRSGTPKPPQRSASPPPGPTSCAGAMRTCQRT